MFGQEAFDRAEEIKPILLVAEAVALVALDDVRDIDPAFFQRFDNLVTLCLLHTRIIRPLRDEQGRLDLVRRKQGGRRGKQIFLRLRIADHFILHLPHRLPIRRHGGEQREDVRRTDKADPRRVNVRRESKAGQCGVSAVTRAIDGNALGIGDPLVDQPLGRVSQVVLHCFAPLLEAFLPERAAVAGRSAEIHLQNSVAAVGEELRFGIESPRIAGPRSAMDKQNRRKILRLLAGRKRQIGRQLESVAGGDTNGLHRREIFLHQPRGHVGELAQIPAFVVVEPKGAARTVAH